jgi:hypothetical protein
VHEGEHLEEVAPEIPLPAEALPKLLMESLPTDPLGFALRDAVKSLGKPAVDIQGKG